MNCNTIDNTLFFSKTYEFLEVYLPKELSRSVCTVNSYRDALTIFRKYLLDICKVSINEFMFEQFDCACLRGFMNFLKDAGCSARTINSRLSALKSYLEFASYEDVAFQSIALKIRKVKRVKEFQPEHKVLSEDAVKAIINEPPDNRIGKRDKAMMVLLYDSACRLDEILSLTLNRVFIDIQEPYIRIIGKGNKERIVPISIVAAKYIQYYLTIFHNDSGKKSDLLFYTTIKGATGKMSSRNVQKMIQRYAQKAKIKCQDIPSNVYPHMFRRTRATHLYQDGVSLPFVSKILGHSKMETTTIYAKPSLTMLREAMESSLPISANNENNLWILDEDEMAKKNGLR